MTTSNVLTQYQSEFTEQTYRNTFTRDDFDWYRELLISMKDRLQAISRLLVADAFFAKQTFILPLLDEGFHVVSRLQGPRSTVFCIFLQVDDPSSY